MVKVIQVFTMSALPQTGYLRQTQILGNPRRGVHGFIPVSATTWWTWVREGKAPAPLKLGPGLTVWRAEDIRALIAELARQDETRTTSRGQSLASARRRKRKGGHEPEDGGGQSGVQGA